MRSSYLPTARAWFAIAIAALAIATAFEMVGSKPAFGAALRVRPSREDARHPKCGVSHHGGRSVKSDIRKPPLGTRARRRSCTAHHPGHSGRTDKPAPPAPAAPATVVGSGSESAAGGSNTPGDFQPTGTPVAESEPPAEEPAPVEPPAQFRFFSPTSFWNEALPAQAPLDPSSAAVMGAFNEAILAAKAANKGPANINATAWSVPIYTVPADQPTVKVTLTRLSLSPALQSAWNAVPLPANAQPAAGTDEHLVVWQPSTDRLWEFVGLVHGTAGWQAFWGGAMQNVSSNPGAYGPEAWPGAQSGWGASATSLSIAGGLITLEDLELGQINHALAIAIPRPRAGVYASPARRTDGWSTEALSIPEGAHLRLDPNLDLAALHLPRLTLMMAQAAQRYGIVVRDAASNVAFYAQDSTPTGTNPYIGPGGYFEGKSPQQLLTPFPWSHLQLLKMELHNTR
jgi:hypothetical protein